MTLFTKKLGIGRASRTRLYAASVGSVGRNCGGTDIRGSAGPLSDVRDNGVNGKMVTTAIAISTAYQPACGAARRHRRRRTVRGRGAATGPSMARVLVGLIVPRPL